VTENKEIQWLKAARLLMSNHLFSIWGLKPVSSVPAAGVNRPEKAERRCSAGIADDKNISGEGSIFRSVTETFVGMKG
jgi:hypothetical protein